MTAGVREEPRDALRALPAAWTRLPTLLTVLAVVAGIGYRLGLLLADAPPTNSDEATMGLAALHITQGREFPVWFYGQRYMGTLEAYLAAPVFALAGPSTFALRVPTLALYAVFLLLAWRLTLRLTADRWFALLVVVVLALGADREVKNQLIAGGGYPEMNAAGVALAVLGYDLAAGRPGRRGPRWAGWGLLAGLLLWVDPLVLPYVAGLALVLVVLRWRELRGQAGALLGLGALVGAAPLLVDSIVAGRSPLDAVLAAAGSGQSAGWADRLHGALVLGPPLGMGFCFPGRCAGWQLWWAVALPLLLLAAAVTAWRTLRTPATSARPSEPSGPGAAGSARRARAAVSLALVGGAVATLAGYALSSSSGRTPIESSRYLSCLLLSVPALLWPLWDAARRWPAAGGRRALGGVAAAGALVAVLGTAGVATAGALATVPAARAEQARHDVLVAALRERGVRHVYGGYWTCNRLTFASREDVVCAVVDDDLTPGHDRYGPYRRAVESSPDAAWLAWSGSPLHERLRADPDFQPLLTVPGWHAYTR
ncbi:hypothetical protein [Micromonospora endolithica]|uniref:Uncharacterized protein n=1 Tax=Micromonospora endolithica TaxID=230091 RepID=A0A3A9ZTW0_9ACTN|nr:hypothetical protein [Micromonospora endolithica]RKN50907.1 hypothetical protein D7223_03935 [Micromonospora endolithica]TWJ20323.1 hypothetical protein JD76_00421 [Micromonospora endolithica]